MTSASRASATSPTAPTPPAAPTSSKVSPLSSICASELARQIVEHDPDDVVDILTSAKSGREALKRKSFALLDPVVGAVKDTKRRSSGHEVNMLVRELAGVIKCDTNLVGFALQRGSTDNVVYDWFDTRDFPTDDRVESFESEGCALHALFMMLEEGRYADFLLQHWEYHVFSPSYPSNAFRAPDAIVGGVPTQRLSYDTTHGCLVAHIETVVDMVGGPSALRARAARVYTDAYGEEDSSPYEYEYTDSFDPNQDMIDMLTEEIRSMAWCRLDSPARRGQLLSPTRPWLVIEFDRATF